MPDPDWSLIDAAGDDFHNRWKDGREPRIEDYLARAPDRARAALFDHLLGIELEHLRGVGRRPKPGDYELRFPDRVAAVRAAFERLGSPEPPGPGDTFPDVLSAEFRILERLGAGGCGEVFLAEELAMGDRRVALKTLRARLDPDVRARLLETLRTEARVLGQLDHPNVILVYACRQAGDEPVLVMRYLPGGSLDRRVRDRGPLPPAEAAGYVADAGAGLLAAHARQILHRDVKPSNILLTDGGVAVLTDFGIAGHVADAGGRAGTPLFMPPEVLRGRPIPEPLRPAGDVYGLAATLYWLLTAAPPFKPDGPRVRPDELAAVIERGLPDPDPRLGGTPPALQQAIRAGLAAAPDRRQNLAEFVSAVRAFANHALADRLGEGPRRAGAAPVALRLNVAVDRPGGGWLAPAPVSRDITRGHAPQTVWDGDRLVIEAVADRPGYLTVFNVGPTGNLHLLHPADPLAAPAVTPGGAPVRVLDGVVGPPAGRERVVAVWTRRPPPVRLGELYSLVRGPDSDRPYRASRDITRIGASLDQLGPDEWHAVVLELDHR